jgi:ion channel
VPAAAHVAEGLLGAAIVVVMLLDVFQSVIVPRPTGYRFRVSGRISRIAWPIWRWIAQRIDDSERREDFLGTFAPLALIVFLVVWVGGLILGYGLLLHSFSDSLRPQVGFRGTLYFAGTSLLTIGYGDIVPVSAPARFVAVIAGASGFGVVAVVTAFLFQIFGAFQRREVFVVTFGTRAGAPPSGVTLLETHARLGMMDHLADVFEEGLHWSAETLEGHLSYPILAYFRSTHDYESWIGTVGALLDASTLLLTTVTDGPFGQAKLVNGMARHLTHDLADYFRMKTGDAVGIDRMEFDTARRRLAEAGLEVRDADDAWAEFARLRSTYATALNAMARFWEVPPAEWVGDRSLLPERHMGAAATVLRAGGA